MKREEAEMPPLFFEIHLSSHIYQPAFTLLLYFNFKIS